MKQGETIRGVGVTFQKGKTWLFYQDLKGKIWVNQSQDGLNFSRKPQAVKIKDSAGKLIKPDEISHLRVSSLGKKRFGVTFLVKAGKETRLFLATTTNLCDYQNWQPVKGVSKTGMIVPDYQLHQKSVLFWGQKELKIAASADLKTWEIDQDYLIKLKKAGFGLRVGDLFITKNRIGLIFYLQENRGQSSRISLRLAFFKQRDPGQVLGVVPDPIWKMPSDWQKRSVRSVGLIVVGQQVVSYWQEGAEFFTLTHRLLAEDRYQLPKFQPLLKKMIENPLLKPIASNFWESQAVFNPAVVYDAGRVHLFYRAVGDNAVSTIGYASGANGVKFDHRSKKPVFVPQEPFEVNSQAPRVTFLSYLSGGGCGGCEDPRITKIDNRFYLTYNAWNGHEPPRVALSSISEADFKNQRWRWKKSVLISNPDPAQVKNSDRINKNWVIFPEKIKGQYAILHSLSPIQVDYFADLDFDGRTFIDSHREWKPREGVWDVFVRSIGPPPIKTSRGWLLIYHAASQDWGYNLGAMLVAAHDPTEILSRAKKPILQPDSWYENKGLKPGIVYSCGAAVVDNQLLVYYGGADTVLCGAQAPLEQFLDQLMGEGTPRLQPMASANFAYH